MSQPRPGDHVRVTSGTLSTLAVTDAEPPAHVETTLTWDSLDPFVLTLTIRFRPRGETDPIKRQIVTWVFAPELIVSGGGHGDVWITLVDDQVVITLNSPSGYAELHIPHHDIKDYADRLQQAMPPGDQPSIVHATDQEWDIELAILTSKRRRPPRQG